MPKIFISIILLVLALVLGVIFLWPRYQEMNDLQAKIDNTNQEIQNLDKYYQELSSISKNLDAHQEELAKIDSALPVYFSMPSFLKFLQKIVPENGLILTRVSFSKINPLPERTNIKEVWVSLELSGSYPSLKNFLKALEKSARLIEVEKISFSVSQEKKGEIIKTSEIFKFQIEIKTYSY